MKVRFKFGLKVATLGDSTYQWTRELFEARKADKPLLVTIVYDNGATTKAFLQELEIVEEEHVE